MHLKRWIMRLLLASVVGSWAPVSAQDAASARPSPDSLRGSLIALNWSEVEVGDAAEMVDGETYLNRRATEKAFKTRAPQAGILHLATHALIDDQNPMYSKFVFAADTDSSEDGYLHTYELYNMRLHAELAVLSACNTGVGRLSQGEGVMSLARGFTYAGVPSVVMSLWPVDDKSTAELTNHFYAGLKAGLKKDAALRQAKLRFLEQADAVKGSPFYWAGMVSIGDPKPIRISSRRRAHIWFAVVGLVFIFGISLWRLSGRKLPVILGSKP